jgi:large subunit ribosomal protein L35
MPKDKTRKALAKRFRVTPKGKVQHGKAGRSHLLSGKSSDRKRKLRKKGELSKADAAKVKRAMHK